MQIPVVKILSALPLLFTLSVQGAHSGHEHAGSGRHAKILDRRTTYPPANLTCPTPGCQLISFPVKGTNAAVFWPNDYTASSVDTAFVVIHGQWRDGGNYYSMFSKTLAAVQKANNYTGVPKNALIASPEYFSKTNDLGLYGANTLAWSWGDWEGGGTATNPKKTTVTAFDVLDALLDEFSNFSKYPSMKRVVFIGHGGGGQLMQRYAVLGKQSRIPIRYVVGNPSSALYFTTDRPTVPGVTKTSCPTYDTYRYGLSANYTGGQSPTALFRQYIGRDVVNIIGLKDVTDGGDQSCPAVMQAGKLRKDRNLAYWRYMNLLAGTNADVSGFPGNFSQGVQDWSSISGGKLSHKLVVVENGYHNLDRLLASQPGQSAIFSLDPDTILGGWRPPSNPNNTAVLRSRATIPAEEIHNAVKSSRLITTRVRKTTSTRAPAPTTKTSGNWEDQAEDDDDGADDEDASFNPGNDDLTTEERTSPSWCIWC